MSAENDTGDDAGTEDVEGKQVELPASDGGAVAVDLSPEVAERVDASRLEERYGPTVSVRANTNAGDSDVIPVASVADANLGSSIGDNLKYDRIKNEQIQKLRDKRVKYDGTVAEWLLKNDDLVPSIRERFAGLILGENGLQVEPTDADKEADKRLAEHMEEVYREEVKPHKVVRRALTDNFAHALHVARSTDLEALELEHLDLYTDAATGERVFVQDAMEYAVVDLGTEDGDPDSVDISTEESEEQALIEGDDVFTVELFENPPLEAVATDIVHKLQLKIFKARRAEVSSVGGVYIRVKVPEWLEEDQYDARPDGWTEDNDVPDTRLEQEVQVGLDDAMETLQNYQSATVMSIPPNWEVDNIELPQQGEAFDDLIRGYNKDIARRFLFSLDLIELQQGSELSRDTLFKTLLNTVAGWRRQFIDLFDDFADMVADIHGVAGSVDHSFSSLEEGSAKQLISLLQQSGVLGLSQEEARTIANQIAGVNLDATKDAMESDREMAPGGPGEPGDRQESMESFLEEQGQQEPPEGGDSGTSDDPTDPPGGPDDADAGAALRVFPVAARSEEAVHEEYGEEIELPTVCRMCEERTRMRGNFRCPECHPDTSPEEYDGPMADDPEPDDGTASTSPPDDGMESAAAASLEEGDKVEVNGARGVVTEIRTSAFTGPDGDKYEPTEDSPVYVVATEEGAVVATPDELTKSDWSTDVDDPADDLAGEAKALHAATMAALPDGTNPVVEGTLHAGPTDWDYPESWKESETPARLILLDAWSSMGGQFNCAGGGCCHGTMVSNGMTDDAADEFCASMKDRVLMWEGWRRGAGAEADVSAAYTFQEGATLREAAHHVRRVVEDVTEDGETVEVRPRDGRMFSVLVRNKAGDFVASLLVRETVDGDGWTVVGNDDLFSRLRRPARAFRAGGSRPFENVPVIPTGTKHVTRDMLEELARHILTSLQEEASARAGDVDMWDVLAEWNPALHPRGPDGKFVERPYDIDMDPSDVSDFTTGQLLRFVDDTGAADVEEILQDDTIQIDGVPDDVNTKDDLDELIQVEESGGFKRGGLDDVPGKPVESINLEAGNRVDLSDLEQGDIVAINGEPFRVDSPGFTSSGFGRLTDRYGENHDGVQLNNEEAEIVRFPEAKPGEDEPIRSRSQGIWNIPGMPDLSEEEGGLNEVPENADPETLAENIPLVQERRDQYRMAPSEAADVPPELEGRMREVFKNTFSRSKVDGFNEEVYRRYQYVSDQTNRAHAGDRNNPAGERMVGMTLGADDPESTIRHELGHNIAQTFGWASVNSNYASDYKNVDQMPDIDVDDPEEFTDYMVTNRENPDTVEGLEEITDAVRSEYGESVLFDDVDTDDLAAPDRELEPGDVLEFSESPEIMSDATEWEVLDRPVPDGFGRFETRLKDKDGQIANVTFEENYDLRMRDAEITGMAKGEAETWRGSDADPADVIGQTDTPESPEQAAAKFVKNANRAWFRQHVAKKHLGKDSAYGLTIGGGYSSTNAHETISRTHEIMQTDNKDRAKREVDNLVDNHPHLVETYLQMFDPSDAMAEPLTQKLREAGVLGPKEVLSDL